MKLMISLSAAPTAAELKRKIKHTEAYAKLKVAYTKLKTKYTGQKGVYAKATTAKRKAMKEGLVKLKGEVASAREKLKAYKEKNGHFIARKPVADLQKQLKDVESGKADGKKVVAKKSATKASPKIASIRSKISRLNSQLNAARGKKHPDVIYGIREKLDAAREELRKAGGTRTTSGKALLERSGKKIVKKGEGGIKPSRKSKTAVSPKIKAKAPNPAVQKINDEIEKKQQALEAARADLKSFRGNAPGDDRNRSLTRSKINDLRDEIKKLKASKKGAGKAPKTVVSPSLKRRPSAEPAKKKLPYVGDE